MRRTRSSGCGITLVALGVLSVGCAATPEVDFPEPDLACAVEDLATRGPIDVALVFNNYSESREPSGVDVDGDGIVGTVSESIFSDRDDSRLNHQLAAARQLVQATADYDIRYSVVTFGDGALKAHRNRASRAVLVGDAVAHAPMSADRASTEAGLDRARERGAMGTARFYGGVRRANQTLIEGREYGRDSLKFALMMSNERGPVYYDETSIALDTISNNMRIALEEAARFDIRFHTFGIHTEAPGWKRLPFGVIGRKSGGGYHPVVHPEYLYCHLVDALLQGTEISTPTPTPTPTPSSMPTADEAGQAEAEPTANSDP